MNGEEKKTFIAHNMHNTDYIVFIFIYTYEMFQHVSDEFIEMKRHHNSETFPTNRNETYIKYAHLLYRM